MTENQNNAGFPGNVNNPEKRTDAESDMKHDSLHGEKRGARGTAAMDQETRKEVARKGGLAVSRNREHMAEIGRKGGQSVSKNREHMAKIGRKGGAASRGSAKTDGSPSSGGSESGEEGTE
jgi:general stress protein YciG